MRATRALLFVTLLVIAAEICRAAPQSRLQVSSNGQDGLFIEEVRVESTLQVRRPGSSPRQSRVSTGARVNLRDGSRVAVTTNK